MTRLDPTLETQIQASPDETFQVVVRVEGDLDARETQLQADGFQVTRRLRLINGFAAMATGETVRHASGEAWIVSIEPDIEMRTMP